MAWRRTIFSSIPEALPGFVPMNKGRTLSCPEEHVRVAVDIVIFTVQSGILKVLLVKRLIPPFKGQCAIPGGFVLDREDLDQAALRELQEETSVSDVYLEQLYSFGGLKRDPRGRVI